jgi:hypothetical protein
MLLCEAEEALLHDGGLEHCDVGEAMRKGLFARRVCSGHPPFSSLPHPMLHASTNHDWLAALCLRCQKLTEILTVLCIRLLNWRCARIALCFALNSHQDESHHLSQAGPCTSAARSARLDDLVAQNGNLPFPAPARTTDRPMRSAKPTDAYCALSHGPAARSAKPTACASDAEPRGRHTGAPRDGDPPSRLTGMMVTARVADSGRNSTVPRAKPPLSAPQARKMLGLKAVLLDF